MAPTRTAEQSKLADTMAAPVPGGQRTFAAGTERLVYRTWGPEQDVWPAVEIWRTTRKASGSLAWMSALVTRRIMIEAVGSLDGEEEVFLTLRQTTHWRSAPWKSQPAQLVAQIYIVHGQSVGEHQVEERKRGQVEHWRWKK